MDSIEKLLLTKVIKPINTVYETEEYSLFGDCPFNRDVFPDHLQKIMFNIHKKDLGEGAPIVVDKNYIIIDGQTRFEARRLLDKPIQFIQVAWLNLEEDIALLNISQRPWKPKDFLHNYSTLHQIKNRIEFENYSLLKDFMYKYSIELGYAIRVFQLRKDATSANIIFKDGKLLCPDINKSGELVQFMQEAFSIINIGTVPYQRALWYIFENKEIDNELFLDTMRDRKNTFRPGLKVAKEYVRWFDDSIINRQTYGKFRENNPHWEKEIPVNFIINDYENKIKAEKIKQLEWMRMIKKDEAQEKLRQKAKRFLQEKEHNKKHRTGPVLGGELGSAPKYIVPEDKE